MAEITFKNTETGSVFTPDGIDKMLCNIIENGKGLSQWEEDFVASLTEYFNRTGKLSENQLRVLERIYVDRTK